MGECNGCGKCCFFPKEKNGTDLIACKFLVPVGKRFICRIYKTRLNSIIHTYEDGTPVLCKMYNSMNKEIVGCPLNEGKKSLINVVLFSSKKGKIENI